MAKGGCELRNIYCIKCLTQPLSLAPVMVQPSTNIIAHNVCWIVCLNITKIKLSKLFLVPRDLLTYTAVQTNLSPLLFANPTHVNKTQKPKQQPNDAKKKKTTIIILLLRNHVNETNYKRIRSLHLHYHIATKNEQHPNNFARPNPHEEM